MDINIRILRDHRGALLAHELGPSVPFSIKRYFVVSDVPIGEVRGKHAHHRCKQFLVCIQGNIEVFVDNGTTKATHELSAGSTVMLNELVWSHQVYKSENSLLLVLCSEPYDRNDYIIDINSFYGLLA